MPVETQSARPVLAPDVIEFFSQDQTAFGAGNLLDSHLPGPARIHDLVTNALTTDYAIARALDAPDYIGWIEEFVKASTDSCSPAAPPAGATSYDEHYRALREADPQGLARMADTAAGDLFETINIFIPKQCNLSCRGCYASAIPVSKFPYLIDDVDAFFDGTIAIATEGKRHGLRAVYTSGDGEPTIYPRFFDLLESFQSMGLRWLFFTAGLAFSNERNAEEAWAAARTALQGTSRDRIARRIQEHTDRGHRKPTVQAYLDELKEYADAVEVYHSLWSSDPVLNTSYRRPAIEDFDYTPALVRGEEIHLPSGLVQMMEEVFVGDLRGRLGIEMPVSDVSHHEIPTMAAFVVDNGLRSYFEPTILTGRNRLSDLMPAQPDQTNALSPILVRKSCGFRNLHQPTVKFFSSPDKRGFFASPGMGVDIADLNRMGVADTHLISGHSLFGALRSPLMTYANYVYVEGCKCNDFAAALSNDRSALTAKWKAITDAAHTTDLTVESLGDRVVGLSAGA